MAGWKLLLSGSKQDQTDEDITFIGGLPCIPLGFNLPACSSCGSEQSFFLQVGFPELHPWAGRSLSVFACTSCQDEAHVIPEMLSGELHGAIVPDGFLERYQVNFQFLVFDTGMGMLRHDYVPRVVFRRRRLAPTDAPTVQTKVGGTPSWMLEDESPGSYRGDPTVFLMQVGSDTTFEIPLEAPRQAKISLDPSLPAIRRESNYRLFLGNGLYFFGDAKRRKDVYVVTQVA